tara:strand:- start:3450 stop:4445 length:996 start_codon:yes stop_codon:yes gene_type:complete
MKTRVGVVGCGAIFNRHEYAIDSNDDFELVQVCDIELSLCKTIAERKNISYTTDYREMDVDLAVICTPNGEHFNQAKWFLDNKVDVLIEKPATIHAWQARDLCKIAKENNRNVYCVLQVRLNPTVSFVKQLLEENVLGDIRGVSLVQRWQRPLSYFASWRNNPAVSGGTLHEVGIHYIDILTHLLGEPKVVAGLSKKIKHINSNVKDSIYAILDFNSFAGTLEVTIAAEPSNLECSISIMGSNGFIKLGGKALNEIEAHNFLSRESDTQFSILRNKMLKEDETLPNDYGEYEGSCPNHATLYRNLDKFRLETTVSVLKTIETIYRKTGDLY